MGKICSNTITIRDVTCLLFKRYLNEFKLEHDLKLLTEKGILEKDNYPIDKLNRWLGYIQAHVIISGQTTVEQERTFSRPLFHKAYVNEGINIPKPFTTKNSLIKEFKPCVVEDTVVYEGNSPLNDYFTKQILTQLNK